MKPCVGFAIVSNKDLKRGAHQKDRGTLRLFGLLLKGAGKLPTLPEKGRVLTRANYPTVLPCPFRDNATKRMMLANMLIDEALRRIAR
ncbi:hypothetical protein HFO63_09395 [Rhizobium laguerreae]|uniref:hypothetical protein n=1 Tax=Rhizobium laguerreae TaxID=1076926 RepID=UPI001C912DB7|nr:hypothetical protein [Rhizobium laguerreae]MBY3084940.1 hypothetical protein [Rhizobium laguerreae]MBY3145802.1 hypothetical protein [Rhizobium laguerreae]MBY3240246.1 hypothetical protein [Rhizobium laguerreae]